MRAVSWPVTEMNPEHVNVDSVKSMLKSYRGPQIARDEIFGDLYFRFHSRTCKKRKEENTATESQRKWHRLVKTAECHGYSLVFFRRYQDTAHLIT